MGTAVRKSTGAPWKDSNAVSFSGSEEQMTESSRKEGIPLEIWQDVEVRVVRDTAEDENLSKESRNKVVITTSYV